MSCLSVSSSDPAETWGSTHCVITQLVLLLQALIFTLKLHQAGEGSEIILNSGKQLHSTFKVTHGGIVLICSQGWRRMTNELSWEGSWPLFFIPLDPWVLIMTRIDTFLFVLTHSWNKLGPKGLAGCLGELRIGDFSIICLWWWRCLPVVVSHD